MNGSDLSYIALKVADIEARLARIADQRSSVDFGMGIIVVLLGLILWRVW